MRYFYTLAVMFCLLSVRAAFAQNWEDRTLFGKADSTQVLRVLSSTDTSFFTPIIQRFLADNPDAAVEYLVTSTAALDDLFRQDPSRYDVVISSAMDLQLKLANDGYAQPIQGLAHPEWAQWRQSLFAFTAEPAAIVINRAAFEGRRIPQTRQDLILALRTRPETFENRVGTYDVRTSGLGYLFATQDARVSETYWRLMEVMGGLNTQLYCCSGEMIDDLADGTIAVAYNVLGSYANARKDVSDKIKVILPSDFPTTMMRTAMVSKTAPHPEAAISLLRHLISRPASDAAPDTFQMPTLTQNTDAARLPIIPLEPALLTYLDALKRQKFIQAWESAIIQ